MCLTKFHHYGGRLFMLHHAEFGQNDHREDTPHFNKDVLFLNYYTFVFSSLARSHMSGEKKS